ncbi:MAG: TrbI/VirB10 family protein, partial [Beijerinckiaceae bacterium]
PITGRVTTTTAQPANQQQQQARQIGAQQISQSLTTIAQDSLKDSIHIPPTVIVNQGEKIEIFVRRDLDFSALYPDPVKQEVLRLRQGGALRGTVDPTPLPLRYSPSIVSSGEPLVIRAPAIVRKP